MCHFLHHIPPHLSPLQQEICADVARKTLPHWNLKIQFVDAALHQRNTIAYIIHTVWRTDQLFSLWIASAFQPPWLCFSFHAPGLNHLVRPIFCKIIPSPDNRVFSYHWHCHWPTCGFRYKYISPKECLCGFFFLINGSASPSLPFKSLSFNKNSYEKCIVWTAFTY